MSRPRALAILPARGGSKGIPGKNLADLAGRPLVAWAAGAATSADTVSRLLCSSDDPAILAAAATAGAEPRPRPADLAGDRVLVAEVLARVLADDDGDEPWVVLVQATSPFVTSSDIDTAVELAADHDADTVICGTDPGQHHPATMFTRDDDGHIAWLHQTGERMARRQDLPPVWVRTGLVYVVRRSLAASGRIYGDHIRAHLAPPQRAVCIDTPLDLDWARFLAGRQEQP